jgi:hypothetical protein
MTQLEVMALGIPLEYKCKKSLSGLSSEEYKKRLG